MADDERGEEQPGWAAPPPPPPPAAPAAPHGGAPPSAAWTQPVPAAAPGQPPRPPRRRRAWIFVLIGVLAVVVVAAGLGTAFFVSNTLPAYDAADDFVTDLADGRFQEAADQLCRADQDDPDRALSVVTRHFPGNDRISVNPFGVDRNGTRATVDYTVTPDEGTGDTYELPLREEGGEWRPCPGDSLR